MILLTTFLIGVLILGFAFSYSRYNSNTHQPDHQSLKTITEDDATFLSCDPQVKDIYTRWQAIKTLTWEKNYHLLFQPRYLYRKGYYISALALSTFNIVCLPSLFGFISYIFCFEGPPFLTACYIVSFCFLITYTIYQYVYHLCEYFIGEQLLMHETYTPAACQEIEALLTATVRLLIQRDFAPLVNISVDEMERLKAALLSAKETYNKAILAGASLTIQREKKEALQAYQQKWIAAQYATYYENELLLRLLEDIQEKEETREKEFNCAKLA
ncbi:MAG: hypothetical protein AAF900_01865 [Bacteroidota bacterium]